MNAENFSRWQLRQGHDVILSESSFWYEASSHVFQAFPYHWVISPTESEINKLFLKNGILAIRYSTPISSQIGKISYHVVQYPPYCIDNVQKKMSKQLKEGLKKFNVKEIPIQSLATKGWNLQLDTLRRHNRCLCMSQKAWESLCYSAEGIPGFIAWGAFKEEELVSFLFTTRIDDTGYLLYSACHHDFLNEHANKVIYYEVTCQMLNQPGIKSLFITVQSLDAPASIDVFKFRMGFQPKYVRQRVVFHPFLRPFVNNFSHSFVKKVLHAFPDSPILPKAEGMFRFYLEGKLPPEKQNLPECMEKEEVRELNLSLPVHSQ